MTQQLARQLLAIQGFGASHEANLPRLLEALRDGLLGQPRAAAYDSDPPSAEVWCDLHEQPVTACHRADEFCTGTVITVHDPTGEAAMRPDDAAIARRRYIKKVSSAYTQLAEADDILREWVTGPASSRVEPPEQTESMWCVSCEKDHGYCSPISERYTTKHLCRWCGDYAGQHGGRTPPTFIVAKRHRGDRITQADVDRAEGHRVNA